MAGSVEGKTSRDSTISTCASALCRARSSSAGSEPDVVRAEDDVDPRRPADDLAAVLLRQAAADGDLHAGAGVLDRPQVAEVAVEPVVGVLPDGAGVEDDDVGVVALGRGGVAGRLEQPGEPLGVVHVHLAPVRAHAVGARGACELGSHDACEGTARRTAGPAGRAGPAGPTCVRPPGPAGPRRSDQVLLAGRRVRYVVDGPSRPRRAPADRRAGSSRPTERG